MLEKRYRLPWQLAKALHKTQAKTLVAMAVDWTAWHSNLRVLSAAVCVGARAAPVLVQAFSATDIPRSQTKPVRVRVIGVWAAGQDEPWWLATTLTCSARRVAAYYDRRMGIEEHFRDSKGCRYGIKIKCTAFTDPAALTRVFLLAAIAGAVWLLAGVLACRADPSLRLDSGRKGPRRSLLAVGIDSPRAIAQVRARSWPRLRPLWPKARLRNFA